MVNCLLHMKMHLLMNENLFQAEMNPFYENLKKEKEFEKFPDYLATILTKLGYDNEISFIHLPADFKELIQEIENMISGINSSEAGTAEKIKICDEVKKLWQKIETFKLPSGHKNYIEGLRCRCKSKVDAGTQTEMLSASTRSLKPAAPRVTKEKIHSLVNKYLDSLPPETKQKEVKIKKVNGDDESWTISCPFCIVSIAVQMKGKNFVASNYKRHIETHKDKTVTSSDSHPNLLTENDSSSFSLTSLTTQEFSNSLEPSTSQQSIELRRTSTSQECDVLSSTSGCNSENLPLSSVRPVRDNRKRNIDGEKIKPCTNLNTPNAMKGLEKLKVKRERTTRKTVRK